MYLDVTDLRDFYVTPLGQIVRRILIHRIRTRWRHVDGQTVIGLGFATPYLAAFRAEALRVGAFMPMQQGALVWPHDGPRQAVLVEEDELPLPDGAVDKLIAIHCLEAAERVGPMLREMWRVLAPQGRIMLVVPSRASVWARFDSTPFGHGRPYTRGQIERILREAGFTPTEWGSALYMPPFERQFLLKWATGFERVGGKVSSRLGGVIIVEAKKELLAPVGTRQRVRMRLGSLVPAQAGARAAKTVKPKENAQ
jgi:SAM-dependent methyltransferase